MPHDQTGPLRSKSTVRTVSGSPLHRSGDQGLDRSIQTHLGRKLQSFYDGLVAEPVPARFEELVARLEQGEAPRRRA